jgi:hypothetical protein
MQRAAMRRTKDGLLIAAGAALMLVVLLVLQSLVGSGLLSTKAVTLTVTTSDAYEQVANAYANHLLQFSARDKTALVSGYESNGTMEWTGAEAAGTGNFSGSTDIGIKLKSFTGKLVNFSLSDGYQSIGVKGDVSVVNSTLDFQGYSSVVGRVNGMIVAQDAYVHVGSSWLIARETWNFTQFNEQFPVT